MADFSTTAGTAGDAGTTGAAQRGTQGVATDGQGDTSRSQTSGAAGASGIVDKVRERANAELTSQKERAFEGIGSVAQAMRQGTQQLRDQHHETLAGYVEQAANQMDRVAQQLRNKDVTELLDDAQQLARRQPALFVGSAFAVGLLGARFLKSSTRQRDDVYGSHISTAGDYGAGRANERYGVGGNRSDRSRTGAGAYPGGGQPSAQYGDASTRGGERAASAGVSPASNPSTTVGSGSAYSSTSEPTLTPSSAGNGPGDQPAPGAVGGSPSGSTRARAGAKSESPSTSGTGRGRRSGSENERS